MSTFVEPAYYCRFVILGQVGSSDGVCGMTGDSRAEARTIGTRCCWPTHRRWGRL